MHRTCLTHVLSQISSNTPKRYPLRPVACYHITLSLFNRHIKGNPSAKGLQCKITHTPQIIYSYHQATMQKRGVPPNISDRHGIWNSFAAPDISGALISGALGGETIKVDRNSRYDTNTASFWRHGQLQNFSTMDTKIMQLCALVDVPEADREVDSSGNKMWRIISRALVVWIEQTCDSAAVTSENLVRQHINCTHPTQ